MSKLEEAISKAVMELDRKEKAHDAVLLATREIIRECAKAIKDVHLGNDENAKKKLVEIRVRVLEIKKMDSEFRHITQQCSQEYAELACLLSIMGREELPTYEELGIDMVSWMLGLCDCVGELRRALQTALRKKDKESAEYYFKRMNEIYDNLMVLKYSSSLVGPLKHKQDVIRGQIEQAMSEMLR